MTVRTDEFVSLEKIDGPAQILRVHPSGKGFGSPFTVACVVVVDGDHATVKALSAHKTFTSQTRKHIKSALVDIGIVRVSWSRIKSGNERNHKTDK